MIHGMPRRMPPHILPEDSATLPAKIEIQLLPLQLQRLQPIHDTAMKIHFPKQKTLRTICAACCCMAFATMTAQNHPGLLRETDEHFFTTHEARRIGDQVLLYQRCTGGWPKNIDMCRTLSQEEKEKVREEKQRRDDSTIDNGATIQQMAYMARLYRATGDARYRDAFRKGAAYLLEGQYENGGWPQFWPVNHGYQTHITYNDNAMVNVMRMLRDIAEAQAPFDKDLADNRLRTQAGEAFQKGIRCILATQIRTEGGGLAIWCQQHDEHTLKPAAARAYELPAYCPVESAALLELLMSLPCPDKDVKEAVHQGMAWMDAHKIEGKRVERLRDAEGRKIDTRLVADSLAQPLWARFYDLEHGEPYVCGRDGIPRRHLEEIEPERRNGYSWYSNRPAALFPLYKEWAKKHGETPANGN